MGKLALYVLENSSAVQSRYRVQNVKEALRASDRWDMKLCLKGEVSKIDLKGVKILVISRQTEKGNKILSSIQTGSVILSINTSQLKKINISLLNLDEQNKLANKYLSKLDSIKIMKSKLQQLEEELGDIGKDNL